MSQPDCPYILERVLIFMVTSATVIVDLFIRVTTELFQDVCTTLTNASVKNLCALLEGKEED